jgi:hypothetical protein
LTGSSTIGTTSGGTYPINEVDEMLARLAIGHSYQRDSGPRNRDGSAHNDTEASIVLGCLSIESD